MDPVHDGGSMDPVHDSGPWTPGPCFVLTLLEEGKSRKSRALWLQMVECAAVVSKHSSAILRVDG